MEAVRKGTMSMNKAAKIHGVPCTTLKDRMSGKVVHGKKPGRQRYLDNALADHLIEAASIGYGKTRSEVKLITEKVAMEKNVLRKDRVTDGSWHRFKKRQPKLSLRRGDATAHVRMDSTNKKTIDAYYNLLESTLEKHNLKDSPAQIYNMDETGMPLDPRPPNIVAKRGQKKVRHRVSGNKEQITVLGCANAIGQAIPPMVICEGKYLNYQWTRNEVPGTYYGMSGKGWTDQELFSHWLKDHFLKYAVPSRPLLLLMDGHSSHYEPSSVELAKENDVILFCLPPHTTQDSQPLDCTVFGPLKRHWSNVCHKYLKNNPGVVISKYNFSEVFSEAWLLALTPANIVSGFRKCGIHPFNRNAIPTLSSGNDSDASDTEITPEDNSDPSSTITDPCDGAQNTNNTTTPAPTPSLPQIQLPDFSDEEVALFERRYEEGYDVYLDEQYVAWLELFHPGVVPSNMVPPSLDSVVDAFGYLSPLHCVDGPDSDPKSCVPSTPRANGRSGPSATPIRSASSANSSGATPTTSSSAKPTSSSATPTTSSGATPTTSSGETSSGATPTTSSGATPTTSSGETSSGATPTTSSGETSSGATPTTSSSATPTTGRLSAKKVSPVTKHLTLPTPGPSVKKKPAPTRAITGARVLTSAECLAIIKEKEEKKKKEEEEKEERKRIREEKKQQREIEKQKKLELRAAKEQEKKRKEAEKEEAKKKKAEEKAQRVSAQQRKRSRVEEPTAGPSSASTSQGVGRTLRSRHDGPSRKAPRLEDMIVANQCCVCFQAFDEDVEMGAGTNWVQCVCTRWLHEDCVLECVMDESGKEKLCPHCVT